MKRLVFCFDGTWNSLAGTPTNVVLAAASIKRLAKHGISQIIYYDEGVGTSWYSKYLGGMFGWGLIENVREAYRFLIFNYDPGDEIYVFGFSRGAFSARSFVGLLRYVGPIRRLHSSRIDEALGLYHQRVKSADGVSDKMTDFRSKYSGDVCINEEDDQWRVKNIVGYVAGSAPILRVKYLGVWDTVSALGVPQDLPYSSQMNVGYRYHDASVTNFIDSARHAVAIDEQRVLFPPVLFGDLTNLNKAKGFENSDAESPYQERWFPGSHGSVGGGGDFRGLSDGALAWILKGAKSAGLELDSASGSRLRSIAPDPFAPLDNARKPQRNPIYQFKRSRTGPSKLWQVATSAIRRWKTDSAKVPELTAYRPSTLKAVSRELNDYLLPSSENFEIECTHVVAPGDTLRALALKFYRNAEKFELIFAANRDTLDDADDLYVGWTLRIPRDVTNS